MRKLILAFLLLLIPSTAFAQFGINCVMGSDGCNKIDAQGGALSVALEDGVGGLISVAGSQLRVVTMPYGQAVAEELLAGHDKIGSFGFRENVQVVAQGSDMWNGTATTQPYPVDAGEQLEIISTSVEDDPDKGGATPGTGIHTVHVHYLDAAGAAQEEVVNLNGTAGVALSETNVRFVQLVHTTVAGTVAGAVGTITIYKQGAAATVYGHIDIGSNRTMSAIQMVPAGKTCYMLFGEGSSTDKSVNVRLRATAVAGELIEDVFIAQGSSFFKDSTTTKNLPIPIKFPALTKIKMTIFVPAGKAGADASGGWIGVIE